MYSILEQACKIKLLIMDIDGMMSDGCIYYNADGEVNKSFNAQDRLGLHLLHSTAVQLAIIADHCVEQRARSMHIDYYSSGVTDKKLGLAELPGRIYLTCEEYVVIGDDLIDLPTYYDFGSPGGRAAGSASHVTQACSLRDGWFRPEGCAASSNRVDHAG